MLSNSSADIVITEKTLLNSCAMIPIAVNLCNDSRSDDRLHLYQSCKYDTLILELDVR